jgi:hypothetical protein
MSKNKDRECASIIQFCAYIMIGIFVWILIIGIYIYTYRERERDKQSDEYRCIDSGMSRMKKF